MERTESQLTRVEIVIPTRNRPGSLSALLARLGEMTDEFDRIIVVDSSSNQVFAEVEAALEGNVVLRNQTELIRSSVASLTHQKNLGLDHCSPDAAVQILDDDVLPPIGYIRKMVETLKTHNLCGISGVTHEARPPSMSGRIFGILFGLIARSSGRVSSGGVGSPFYTQKLGVDVQKSDWLIGCSMWDMAKVRDQRFHAQFLGSALFEDVEFSYRMSRKHSLSVDGSQTLFHSLSQIERPDGFTHWFRFSRNRFEVIKLVSKFPKTVLVWSSLGLLLQITFGSESKKLRSATGLLKGAASALRGGRFV
jgi:glycosyltransferase involved in cell wall biosynthesis